MARGKSFSKIFPISEPSLSSIPTLWPLRKEHLPPLPSPRQPMSIAFLLYTKVWVYLHLLCSCPQAHTAVWTKLCVFSWLLFPWWAVLPQASAFVLPGAFLLYLVDSYWAFKAQLAPSSQVLLALYPLYPAFPSSIVPKVVDVCICLLWSHSVRPPWGQGHTTLCACAFHNCVQCLWHCRSSINACWVHAWINELTHPLSSHSIFKDGASIILNILISCFLPFGLNR